MYSFARKIADVSTGCVCPYRRTAPLSPIVTDEKHALAARGVVLV